MASLLDAFKLPAAANTDAERKPDLAALAVEANKAAASLPTRELQAQLLGVSAAPAVGVLPPDAAPREQKVKLTMIDVPSTPEGEGQPAPAPESTAGNTAPTEAKAVVGPPPEALEGKRGRGRPRGAKNKPKEFTPPAEAPSQVATPSDAAGLSAKPAVKTEGIQPEVAGAALKIERITLRHGAKVGMPDFSSVTVEAEYTALVTGNAEDAREQLSMFVKAAMMRELEIYVKQAEAKMEAKKNHT